MLNLNRKIYSMLTLSILSAALTVNVQAADTSVSTYDYGNAAPVEAAQRQIVLTPATKWVNVNNGETVKFVADGKAFAWHIDTFPPGADFDLAAIAPKDLGVQGVHVFVAKNPLFQGGR